MRAKTAYRYIRVFDLQGSPAFDSKATGLCFVADPDRRRTEILQEK